MDKNIKAVMPQVCPQCGSLHTDRSTSWKGCCLVNFVFEDKDIEVEEAKSKKIRKSKKQLKGASQ